jgi:hypothetical protein
MLLFALFVALVPANWKAECLAAGATELRWDTPNFAWKQCVSIPVQDCGVAANGPARSSV